MSRSIFLRRRGCSTLFLGAVCSLFGLGTAQAAKNVEVVVNNALYTGGQITASLNQYLSDLQLQGYTPHLTTSSFSSTAALRSYLTDRYNSAGIEGAVMIGDLPVEHFERNGQFGDSSNYQRFACDLYYMDVDGTWSDSTANGTYDTHTGNVSPEIWVSHMITSTLTSLHSGRTEASLLNDYFAKDRQYRTRQISMPQNGLAYIDDDWRGFANLWGGSLAAAVPGTTTIISNGTTTTAADFMSRLAPATLPGYESVLVCAHSNSQLCLFKIGNEWTGGYLYNSQIADWNPQAFFYNLFNCSNANYESQGYMGGEYIFGTDTGLFAVGSTKTGSMLDFNYYYDPLGQGATFGEAYLDWWQALAADGFSSNEMDWHYGMTIIGDPLLRTQAFAVPEPASLALLVAGLAYAFSAHFFRYSMLSRASRSTPGA
jgi:hypothetical protein